VTAPPAATDVHRTVEYRSDRWVVSWLPYTLLFSAVGLYMVVYEYGRHRSGGVVVLAICGAASLFLLYRWFTPGRARLMLTPAGLQMHAGGRDILIPWREIASIETTELKVRNWGRGSVLFPYITFHDCTIARISRQFYEEAIHVPSVFMRGPGWEGVFQPDGDGMRIALHHEQFCVTPQEVRAPVEARWRAFRGRSHPAVRAEEEAVARGVRTRSDESSAASPANARRTAPSSAALAGDSIRYGDSVSLLATPWDAIKLTVALAALLVVATNAVGMWETAAQTQRRLAHEAAAEERRRDREEDARRKKKWDDMWKDFDRTMKRTFPE
jgi:hypothetical protein